MSAKAGTETGRANASVALLFLGGFLEFLALMLLGYSSFLLAMSVGAFPLPDYLRLAYNAAGWGYVLAALGLPFLLPGLALGWKGTTRL